MLTVSATEFQKNFAKYQDAALVQPVTVTQNGRERIVILSAETYRQMQLHTREVLPVSALSDADLADSPPPSRREEMRTSTVNLTGTPKCPCLSLIRAASSATLISGMTSMCVARRRG